MKIVTAHILRTGEVVYRAKSGGWTPHLAEAAPFDDEHANDELAKAKGEATLVTNVYLVGIEGPGHAGLELEIELDQVHPGPGREAPDQVGLADLARAPHDQGSPGGARPPPSEEVEGVGPCELHGYPGA